MKDLVDVLYYDYVLYKLAHLYTRDSRNGMIVQYQKIAQKLLVKIRLDKVMLDEETGLKFAYIKLYDLHLSFPKCIGRSNASCCQDHCSQFMAICRDYLSRIVVEYSALKECDMFKRLFRLTSLVFAFSFPVLPDCPDLRLYLSQQNIDVETKDGFEEERTRFLRSMGITLTDGSKVFNRTFERMMEELEQVFLSFNIPVLQFFGTSEAIRLKNTHPQIFGDFEGIPASIPTYKRDILDDYLELKDSLCKARKTVIRPKDEGERIEWSSNT